MSFDKGYILLWMYLLWVASIYGMYLRLRARTLPNGREVNLEINTCLCSALVRLLRARHS